MQNTIFYIITKNNNTEYIKYDSVYKHYTNTLSLFDAKLFITPEGAKEVIDDMFNSKLLITDISIMAVELNFLKIVKHFNVEMTLKEV